MRVLIFNYEFPPLGGGAANATLYLLKELADSDIEIDLVTSSTDIERIDEFASNIRVHYLDIGKEGNSHYQSNGDLLRYSKKALSYGKKLLKQEDYDGVHAFFGIPCGYIAMKLGLPYIVSLRGSDVPFYNERFRLLDTLIFQRLSKKIWRKASAVIANSNGLRDLALESAPEQRIDVIFNGVDTNEFSPYTKKAKNVLNIVCSARLIQRKGIQYLLEAFLSLASDFPKTKLTIVGGGDIEEELREHAAKSAHAKRVDFLGVITHNEMATVYRSADIFVLPSLNEGMSNSLLEAMASGLAIVATNTGGTEELVDESNGFIVPLRNANAIAEALVILLHQPEKLRVLQQESRSKAEEFSWTKVAQQTAAHYKRHFTPKI